MTRQNKRTVRSKHEIPHFASEGEERTWWSSHDLSEELYDELEPEFTSIANLLRQEAARDGAVDLIVDGLPPVYGAAQSLSSPKHPHAKRVAVLQREAEQAMRGRSPLQHPVAVLVSQEYTERAMADAANVLGAISNALEGIVYANDRLIREVHFGSRKASRSRYRVKVVPLP